jgi:hypothetical protein
MFINLSNHPSSEWSQSQLLAASKYGLLVDIPFPVVDPHSETGPIVFLAENYEIEIRKMVSKEPRGSTAVHIMGELTFCFKLVVQLQKVGIRCLLSTTNRQTIDQPDGTKISRFEFVRFREYPDFKLP